MKKQNTALSRQLFAAVFLAFWLASPGIALAGNNNNPPAPPNVPNSNPGSTPQGLVQGQRPNWQNVPKPVSLPGKRPGARPNQMPGLPLPENAEDGTGEAEK